MATNPTLLIVPIAQNGTKNTIPQNQATPGNGLMSQSTGFPAECSLPLGAGGVAPDRADFNGAFNLLGGVAFYAQKGWRFQFSNTQDYYAGCIVIDTTDGNAYQAIADVSAGGSVPSLDTTHWILYAKQAATESAPFIPAFNKRTVITTSGIYTAPVTGWYKITVKGGGAGGQGGGKSTAYRSGGTGGGEGGTSIAYEKMTAGSTATVVIGAGGAGGSTGEGVGGDGGNSTVTVNSHTYTGGGATKATGGTGTIKGASANPRMITAVMGTAAVVGSSGAGEGGGWHAAGVNGGGGAGGGVTASDTVEDGFAGGNGYATFEYFDSSLN